MGAALDLVDDEGADALSMRTLAQRLGSGTATLYRHFAGRTELVAMVVDRMLGEVSWEHAVGLAWDEVCISFAQNMFDALRRHGKVAPLLVGHVPMGPHAMAQREFLLSVLIDSGFPAQTAARIYATLSRYVLGFAMQVCAESQVNDAQVETAFQRLDPARYPATTAAADQLPVPLADEFDFGLRSLVAGLAR